MSWRRSSSLIGRSSHVGLRGNRLLALWQPEPAGRSASGKAAPAGPRVDRSPRFPAAQRCPILQLLGNGGRRRSLPSSILSRRPCHTPRVQPSPSFPEMCPCFHTGPPALRLTERPPRARLRETAEHCHRPRARRGRGRQSERPLLWESPSSIFCWLYRGAHGASGCLLGISPTHQAPDPSCSNLNPAFCIPLSRWKSVQLPTDRELLFFVPFLHTHLHPHLLRVSKLPLPENSLVAQ